MDTGLYFSRTLRRIEAEHADAPLMQRAGAAAAEWAAQLCDERCPNILVLAGPGNNGGDALEAATLLRQKSFPVTVVLCAAPESLPSDAQAACQRFFAGGGSTVMSIPEHAHWGLIIDGLFGIGLSRAPGEHYASLIAAVNRKNCPILALDCPSGLNADTGFAFSPCIQASHTLTFIGMKPGLLTADGPDHCGEVRLATLDIAVSDKNRPDGRQLGTDDFSQHLAPRARNTHKGSFGSVGILGGSKSMLGAALLAGRAALKLGAGRVYLGLLDPDAPVVDIQYPELMLRRADTLLATDLRAVACGPGLGRSSEATRLLEQATKAPLPLVLDADAINLLAEDGRLEGNLYNRVGPVILTPHPAEAARLLSCSTREIQDDRVGAAREISQRYQSHVALKGCGTVLATVDGRWWINGTGNPGMATAGMGDVLTGLVASLLGQGWPADSALLCAVHVHGAAADLLLEHGIGPAGMTAGEIIDPARSVFNQWIRLGYYR